DAQLVLTASLNDAGYWSGAFCTGTIAFPITKASAKARAARVHFASSTSPTQSIPTDTCGCSASRWRPKHPATAGRMSRSRCRLCGLEPPGPGGFRHEQRLGERRRRDEREHEGKGYFHWVNLCLRHYWWDTAAVRH